MKSLLIIDTLQEFADTGASVMEIAVFVAVDLLIFQRFHEGFAGRIGEGGQLRRMATLRIPTSR
jgi:hypothetical protein